MMMNNTNYSLHFMSRSHVARSIYVRDKQLFHQFACAVCNNGSALWSHPKCRQFQPFGDCHRFYRVPGDCIANSHKASRRISHCCYCYCIPKSDHRQCKHGTFCFQTMMGSSSTQLSYWLSPKLPSSSTSCLKQTQSLLFLLDSNPYSNRNLTASTASLFVDLRSRLRTCPPWFLENTSGDLKKSKAEREDGTHIVATFQSIHKLKLSHQGDRPRRYTTLTLEPYSNKSDTTSRLEALEFRVSELEYASKLNQLTKYDSQNEIWSLLAECASFDKININNTKSIKEGPIAMAKLSNRLLQICLDCVEARRVLLWQWLNDMHENAMVQGMEGEGESTSSSNDSSDKFSPAAFWKEAPHPTKEMYNLVFSAWKNVIESCSSSSISVIEAMEIMESSAQHTSSLLLLMEDECSSDMSFVNLYNARIDKSKYASLVAGAAIPDVRNYGEVLEAWGRCIGGSVFRQPEQRGRGRNSDETFQIRLRLEACAMKAMMEFIESMEEDLYENFSSGTTKSDDCGDHGVSSNSSTCSTLDLPRRKRPPPDRVCYNILLAAMARQTNPSLYEMRLVLQRMMERVKYELEHASELDIDADSSDQSVIHPNSQALSFFPDAFSYNALIEARANRSAMFASVELNHHLLPSMMRIIPSIEQQQHQERLAPFQTLQFWRLRRIWQQRPLVKGCDNQWRRGENEQQPQLKYSQIQGRRRFTSSEEEAILAEQILEEMCHLVTMPVRPNIWSYNAVIKAWIKSGGERGLERAVLILRALALNGDKSRTQYIAQKKDTTAARNTVDERKEVPTVFERISRWGASLLVREKQIKKEGTVLEKTCLKRNMHEEDPNGAKNVFFEGRDTPFGHQNHNQSPTNAATVGMASRLNYLYSAIGGELGQYPKKSIIQPKASGVAIGMSSRMALMCSALQGSYVDSLGPDNSKSSAETRFCKTRNDENKNDRDEKSELIVPLPYIEPSVIPNLNTFKLTINALERRGTSASAALAEDLLHLLQHCFSTVFKEVHASMSHTNNDYGETPDLAPDIAVYNSVLNAWAQAGKEANDAHSSFYSAQRADGLLREMLEKDPETVNIYPPPNESSFLMAINAWAYAASFAVSAGNVSDGEIAAERAESLLNTLQKRRLQTSQITIACFGSVIRTWASLSGKSRSSVGHAARAQAVLEKMVEDAGRIPLDLIPFNAVLDAWARELASTKNYDEAISRMLSMHDMLVRMNTGGDYQSYNVKPDTSSFNHVIRACYAPWVSSRTCGLESAQKKALGIALDTYSIMNKGYNCFHRPDAHTYSHMFKAIACLLPPKNSESDKERFNLCKPVFEACCRDGHLTKSSLWVLRTMVQNKADFVELLSSQLGHNRGIDVEKLLSIPDLLYTHLPVEWSRNGRKYKALNSFKQ